MKALLLLFCLLLTACSAPVDTCERTPDMPARLRMDHYRSPTPVCVPNGITLDIAGLQQLQQDAKPVLIDVWAILLRKEEGFPSAWLPSEDHYTLPDAVWLPNVGYGTLESDIEYYLQTNLQRLTKGNKETPLIFFCVADCWMSWNTVQRVREYGYTQVYWFKNGTDGWDEAGLPLVKTDPVPIEE